VPGEGAGVKALHAKHSLAAKVVFEGSGGAEIVGVLLVLAHNEGRHLDGIRFNIISVDPVASHKGIGHGDKLAPVGRVCKNLLVAGHACVENHLAKGFAGAGEGAAFKAPSVFKGQKGLHGFAPLIALNRFRQKACTH
jgi:hypothetical protein